MIFLGGAFSWQSLQWLLLFLILGGTIRRLLTQIHLTTLFILPTLLNSGDGVIVFWESDKVKVTAATYLLHHCILNECTGSSRCVVASRDIVVVSSPQRQLLLVLLLMLPCLDLEDPVDYFFLDLFLSLIRGQQVFIFLLVSFYEERLALEYCVH